MNRGVSKEAIQALTHRLVENDMILSSQLDASNTSLSEQIQAKENPIADSEDVTVSRTEAGTPSLTVTDQAAKRLFDLQWVEAGGGIVEPGTTYSLNGIEDLTFSQASNIFSVVSKSKTIESRLFKFATFNGRTLFPIAHSTTGESMSHKGFFKNCSNLEKVVFKDITYPYEMNYFAYHCGKLREIEGILDLSQTSTTSVMFENCSALEEVRLRRIKISTNFSYSPKLSYDTINYMVSNAANTTAITLTFHADVFAKLVGDDTSAAVQALSEEERAAWLALGQLAATKNIIIATA